MGDFSTQLKAFADKAMGNAENVIRKTVEDLGVTIVLRNPVGNPSLWKINQYAAGRAKMVASYNAHLRENPNNLDKAGRLKKGLKIKDAVKPLRIPENLDKAGRFKRGLQNAIIRA